MVIRVRDEPSSAFRTWLEAGPEDSLTLNLLDFSADGKSLYLISALGRDTAAVVKKDVAGGGETELASSAEADADNVLIHPRTHVVQAVRFSPGRSTWKVVDPSIQADFDAIAKLHDGDFSVVNRDQADKTWLVAFTSDRGPVSYYAWDRAARKGTFLFVHQPKLAGPGARRDEADRDQGARRPDAQRLPDAPRGRRAEGPAPGADGPRRPLGPG